MVRQSDMFDFQLGDCGVHQLRFQVVDSQKKNRAFRVFTRSWHRYKPSALFVGRQLNYLVYLGVELVGTIGLASPILNLPVRDEFIGWGRDQTYRPENPKWNNLSKVANNWRFTLKSGVPFGLGSQILSVLVHKARTDWVDKYDEKLLLLESLVKPPFKGTVYKASGWICIGETSGYSAKQVDGKAIPFGRDKTNCSYSKLLKYTGEKKLVFVKPLHRFWRERLLR